MTGARRIIWTASDRDRGECPVPDGAWVTAWSGAEVLESGNSPESWDWGRSPIMITEYMVHKTRGQQMTDANDTYVQGGKTLRDEFAGLALTGLLSNNVFVEAAAKRRGDDFEQAISGTAYMIADAMLEVRGKEGGK